jgi:hypothetical protein
MSFCHFLSFIGSYFMEYRFSDFAKIRIKTFDELVNSLNPNQTIIYLKGDFKIIEWHDPFTLFVVVFNRTGDFVCIEREVWYEYKFPFFKKTVILDTKNIF